LAARYSHLDLNDGAIRGGVGNEVTAGLNWYLFPALRWTGNYLWAHRNNFGDISGWQMRFQLEF
jgi:phosphate-selective porin OprO/OprP